MYNDFKFAEEAPAEVFTDVNQALQRAYEVTVTPISAVTEDIQVTSKGSIIFQGEEKLISQRGLESFFKVIGLPPLFARKIPTDLLLHNVTNLIKDNPAIPIFVLSRPNTNIASIVKDPYTEIPYGDILGRFIEKPIKSIELSESLLKVIFTFDELKVPDLDDNTDTLYVGEYLTASITKVLGLQINSGLFRTQCQNSFIMPLLGKLKANYMKKEDVRLARFADSFECYDQNLIATVFRNFVEKKTAYLKEHQVKQVWEKFSKLLSKSDADILFQFDEDTRKAVISGGQQFMHEYKKAEKLGLELPEASNTPYNLYSIANEITSIAHTRTHDVIDQVKMEVLGGTMLQWMIFSN